MCLNMISNAVESGHKILLFSQFTTMLDHLAKRLEEEKISYYMLTGSTSKEKRAQMVENFNTDDTQVFCISLKAGGTGLNLTAADIVIHFDMVESGSAESGNGQSTQNWSEECSECIQADREGYD